MTDIPEMPDILGYDFHDIERGERLGNAPSGSGHDTYLKGIIVQVDIEAPAYWWPQWMRYNFQDTISSQSKMHKIEWFDLKKKCTDLVDDRIIAIAQDYIDHYKKNPTQARLELVLSNLPQGFETTAAVTTSFLQLKTMYYQRETHRLRMWNSVFKEWVTSLPQFTALCLQKHIDKKTK